MSSRNFKQLIAVVLSLVLLVGFAVAPASALDMDTNGMDVLTDGPNDTFYEAPAGANCYYIDSEGGNDDNDGLSPETAWKTTQKANTVVYQPGDHILYKRGGEYVGSLVPQGSGTEENPIVIASYGDSSERAVLTPTPEGDYVLPEALNPTSTSNGTARAAGYTLPKLNADYVFYPYWYVSNQNNPYFGVDQIRLANVEHYEIRDLELYDPNYETNLPVATGDSGNNWADTGTRPNQRYRRGILVYNEDSGVLSGFTFDNLTIHGYRGTNSNRGKSGGGIIFQTNTNGYAIDNALNKTGRARDGSSTINDISITNCELYNLGRDGINFTSPWCGRTSGGTTTDGDQWRTSSQSDYNSSMDINSYPGPGSNVTGSATVARPGFVPSENVYISNNIMHDMDGDATIIDGCNNVVMENNLVYRCERSVNMAVGIFTWNTDNATFQYNECYDMYPADARGANGDGQGMEIDALCRDVVFQYNYTHNNAGGWLMNCCTNDPLRGFRYIWRYNISQNDGRLTNWGILEWRQNVYGVRVYNNTIIWNNSSVYFLSDKDSSNTNRDAKIFNNLFYYNGDTAMNSARVTRITSKTNLGGPNVEWTNNYFYNFPTTLTQSLVGGVANNNTIVYAADAITGDDNPLLVDPGKGVTGDGVPSKSNVFESLKGYMLKEGSPLIGAGRELINDGWSQNTSHAGFNSHDTEDGFNGGLDFFGRPVSGTPDIGAVEYVNFSELEELIATAEGVDEDIYWDVDDLNAALAVAQAVLADDKTAVQPDIDAAAAALQEALYALTALPGYAFAPEFAVDEETDEFIVDENGYVVINANPAGFDPDRYEYWYCNGKTSSATWSGLTYLGTNLDELKIATNKWSYTLVIKDTLTGVYEIKYVYLEGLAPTFTPAVVTQKSGKDYDASNNVKVYINDVNRKYYTISYGYGKSASLTWVSFKDVEVLEDEGGSYIVFPTSLKYGTYSLRIKDPAGNAYIAYVYIAK